MNFVSGQLVAASLLSGLLAATACAVEPPDIGSAQESIAHLEFGVPVGIEFTPTGLVSHVLVDVDNEWTKTVAAGSGCDTDESDSESVESVESDESDSESVESDESDESDCESVESDESDSESDEPDSESDESDSESDESDSESDECGTALGAYFLDIVVTGLNDGDTFHGNQLVAVADALVFDVALPFATVVVNWTADTAPRHTNELYTVCVEVLHEQLGVLTTVGTTKCQDFGPF